MSAFLTWLPADINDFRDDTIPDAKVATLKHRGLLFVGVAQMASPSGAI